MPYLVVKQFDLSKKQIDKLSKTRQRVILPSFHVLFCSANNNSILTTNNENRYQIDTTIHIIAYILKNKKLLQVQIIFKHIY